MTLRTVLIIGVLVFSLPLFAQANPAQNTHLFQSFYRDAPIVPSTFVDGGLDFSSFEYYNNLKLGVRAGTPINKKVDIATGLHFINFSPEHGDGQSGLSDIWLSGKYKINNVFQSRTDFSAGGYLTLPVGSEDVGQSHFNFGAFGAIRHPLDNKMTLTGTLGLDFLEDFAGDQTSSLLLGAGLIYTYDPKLNFVGEVQMQSEFDFAMLSVGTDYLIQPSGHLRGALGVGLDDGAPDFMLIVSYLTDLGSTIFGR